MALATPGQITEAMIIGPSSAHCGNCRSNLMIEVDTCAQCHAVFRACLANVSMRKHGPDSLAKLSLQQLRPDLPFLGFAFGSEIGDQRPAFTAVE